MAIDFPSSPASGDVYSFDERTWEWDGSTWRLRVSGTINYNIDGGGPGSVYGGQPSVDGGGVN